MEISSTTNLRNWLAFYHSPGIGIASFHAYLQLDPRLEKLPSYVQPDWQQVARDLQWLSKTPNAHIVSFNDAAYPFLLKQIADPPPLLYVQGDIKCLAQNQLAIVGSRAASHNGKEQAFNFASHFAQLGVVITSGLALGVDGASHAGALSVCGKTIAVLGNGLDQIFPLTHVGLAQQIAASGCLVSEFPIGCKAQAHNFPRRNRIISGLSKGVLVVEATLRSGSLITARYALEQNREVFAIPGCINNAKIKGCHRLISSSAAKLVDSAADILEDLPSLLPEDFHAKRATPRATSSQKISLSSHQVSILQKIDDEPTCVDLIVGRTGLETGIVNANLLELELRGLIAAVPGGYARSLSSF